jgi:site-specific DNA-cytosine methylase
MGINVLSLFDGMSCGQIALEKAGIEVNNYYASEIDKYAIAIAKKNYPNTKHIGSVIEVKGKDLPKIDLLIGGSPCQGFSTAGNELNFKDPRSKLFFEFVRILKETKPNYFLLENVGMKKEFRDIISGYLGCEPIHINSAKLTAQNRPRFYWTNIANVTQPVDKGITTYDILGIEKIGQMQPFPRNYKKIGLKRIERFEARTDGKSNCCLARSDKNLYETETGIKKLTPNDYEKLQTVPENYTKGVSNTQRYKMLGNGWTVDVIAHIFKNIEL